MKVYVYVVLLKRHVMCVGSTIESALKGLLEQGFSGDEYLLSVEEIQAELEEDPESVVFIEKDCFDFRLYQIPLVGELPKPKSEVTIDITPKQLKQESFEVGLFLYEEIEENEVEINNRIDQAKEDDQLPW